MNISLIANSGIQFFKFEATLIKDDFKEDRLRGFGLWFQP